MPCVLRVPRAHRGAVSLLDVNDTLSPRLVDQPDASIDAGTGATTTYSTTTTTSSTTTTYYSATDEPVLPRISQRTRALADQTKLLPPSARGEAWRARTPAARAQLARRLKQLALREAARAFANAQRARALILAGLGVANASQPLIPIVQLHVSAECFDPTLVSERPVVS